MVKTATVQNAENNGDKNQVKTAKNPIMSERLCGPQCCKPKSDVGEL